jgi:hypothetical protein
LTLASFLKTLSAESLALVDRTQCFESGAEAFAAWHALEEAARADLPGNPPSCNEAAGLWAAERLYFICQAIVIRDLDAQEVRPRILEPCPSPRNPSADYSADICLRHLPDVARLARQLAASDPVNDLIQEFAATWPLSAAGVPQIEFTKIETFWPHPTLRRVFVDRVLAHQATAALQLPPVLEAIRAALGAHPDLAPTLAASLPPS